MRLLLLLLLLLPAWAWSATVTDDTLTGTVCGDGLVYVGGCPSSSPTYYVDSVNGNDSRTGLSYSQSWRTLAKVNSSVTTRGSDVCLMEDSVWTSDRLYPDWGGTLADPAIIAGCYTDTGSGNAVVRWDQGTGSGRGARPNIKGNTNDACIAARSCFPNLYHPLVYFYAVTDMQFKHVDVTYSESAAVQVTGTGYANVGSAARIVIYDITCRWIMEQCVVLTDGVQDIVVKNNTATYGELCKHYYTVAQGGCEYWGNAFVAVRSIRARSLFEGNYCGMMGGECFASHITSHLVVRGNVAAESHSTSIYMDGGDGAGGGGDHIIESNITWGPTGEYTLSGAPFGGGIGIRIEVSAGLSTPNLVRNNLIMNAEDSALQSQVYTFNAWLASSYVDVNWYGNTIISTDAKDIWILPNSRTLGLRSNAIISLGTSAADKCVDSAATEVLTSSHNIWPSAPTWTTCRGASAVIDTPTFARTYAWFDTVSTSNPATFPDAAIAAGSPVIGRGDSTLDDTTCINLADYGTFILDWMTYPYAPDWATWVKCLAVDALGRTRSPTAPTPGALEPS